MATRRRPTRERPERTVTIAELEIAAPAPSDAIIVTTTGRDTPTAEQQQRLKVGEFLSHAKKRFKVISNAESSLRERMMEDLRFRASEQWDPMTKAERQTDGRPCLTINRISQFLRQVTNGMRQANLAVKVTPVDDGADVKVAEVFQGLVRHIEQQSDAQVAYQTAGEAQATMGRGYWRIVTEYEDDRSFNQTIRIKRIRNPFTVYVDPAAQEADGSDARFAFIVEDVPKEEYKQRFGDAAMASLNDFMAANSGRDIDWMPEGKVKIAEYWYIEPEPTTLHQVQMPDGTTEPMFQDEFDALLVEYAESVQAAAAMQVAPPPAPKSLQSRPVTVKRVKQALINAVEVLEGNPEKTAGRDWPGRWIPIVQVLGDEIDVNGSVDYRGMVRDAKDPQRLYNYQNSALAETLALVPRVPWIGYEGQFEGHEGKWKTANRRAWSYIEVKPVSLDGKNPMPLPERTSASADVGGIMTAIQQSDQDLKATMGLFEPSLGVRDSASQSGKAIQALQKQGELANSNFLDNMGRAIRFTGKIIVDLAPHIFDVPRVIRIIGEDENERKVMIQAKKLGLNPELPEGVAGIYSIDVGRYDVIVQSGPSTSTKRDQALQALTTFVQAYPEAFPMVGDLILGSLDWPGARAAAKRLKAAMPPEIRNADEDGAPPPIPPEVEMQMQQLMQQLEAAGVELQEAQEVIKTKQVEQDGKMQLQRMKFEADLILAQVKAQMELAKIKAQGVVDERIVILEAEIEARAQTLERLHERALAAEGFSRDRMAAGEDRREGRVDAALQRMGDREDSAMERSANRQDAAAERVANRVDTDRARQADRQDTAAERQANRVDTAIARRDDRQDTATARRDDRQDTATERQANRVDTTVERRRNREDAATEFKRNPPPKPNGKSKSS